MAERLSEEEEQFLARLYGDEARIEEVVKRGGMVTIYPERTFLLRVVSLLRADLAAATERAEKAEADAAVMRDALTDAAGRSLDETPGGGVMDIDKHFAEQMAGIRRRNTVWCNSRKNDGTKDGVLTDRAWLVSYVDETLLPALAAAQVEIHGLKKTRELFSDELTHLRASLAAFAVKCPSCGDDDELRCAGDETCRGIGYVSKTAARLEAAEEIIAAIRGKAMLGISIHGAAELDAAFAAYDAALRAEQEKR